MTTTRSVRRAVLGAVLFGAANFSEQTVYAQAGGDPFSPGLRWADASTQEEPWIARSLDFGADGELLWAAPSLGTPHVALYATGGSGAVDPLFTDPIATAGAAFLAVAGGGAAELFALAQHEVPGGSPAAPLRRTTVSRYDAPGAAGGGPFQPAWTYDFGVDTTGTARLARAEDGGPVVAALHHKEAGKVVLAWLDPSTGASLVASPPVELPGAALSALAVADGGERVALVAGTDLYVVDRDRTVAHAEALGATTNALELAGDGSAVAVGQFGFVRVLEDVGGPAFVLRCERQGQANEVPTRLDVDADGHTIAVGWWNYQTGVDVRLEVFDGFTGAPVLERSYTGPGGGLQNYPDSVRVTPDGARIAFGLWGLPDSTPELVLLDRGSTVPLLEEDLAGSVYALDLDASGTRVAVGIKHAHANEFSTTGAIQQFDTGERDVQVVDPAELGGVLGLAARHAGASAIVFALGSEAPPTSIPGLAGELRLDLSAPLLLRLAPAGADGRADLQLAVPSSPSLAGVQVATQTLALTVGGAHFSAFLARPLVL